jgi:predicted signal transduction protein with EAL and GGDEF domain
MEDSEAAFQRLESLKALGVRLAIDDFGTGYSSLNCLRRLPVDVLKVDKSFVDGIVGGGQAFALARVIVSIGQTLQLDAVAEGVEMSAQAAALRARVRRKERHRGIAEWLPVERHRRSHRGGSLPLGELPRREAGGHQDPIARRGC